MRVKNIFYTFTPLILSLILFYFVNINPVLLIAVSTSFLIWRIYVGAQYYGEEAFIALLSGNAFLFIGIILYYIQSIFELAFLEKINFITKISSTISFSLMFLINSFFGNSFLARQSELTCFIILNLVFLVGHFIGLKLSTRNKYRFDKNLFAANPSSPQPASATNEEEI